MKARLLFSLFLLSLGVSFGQKIVAYLPDYRDPSPTNIQYTKLTHVIFSFANPDADGDLVGINTPNTGNTDFDFNMNNFLIARSQCYPVKPDGPKLVISIGGADGGDDRSNRLNTVCATAAYRDKMIDQLIAFAITYDLEGIDVDWEFPTTAGMRTNHEGLLQQLRAKINASANTKLRIGIAIGGETPGGHINYINSGAFQYVDDFHLMAYDLPSAYDANNHAPYSAMQNMINNWAAAGVPRSKMILGVPFYGRTPARTATSDYRVLVTTAAQADSDGPTSGYYYNGRPTLRNKVDLIMNATNCGQGIMIWDIGQDRTDGLALLDAIHTRMTGTTCALTPSLGVDVNHCSGTTTLTVGGVSAASGRTFDWYRNGTLVTQTTANNYGITQGGKWKVVVTDGCCKEVDEIVVTAGNTVSGTNATRCGTGTVSLGASGGSTYDWYSAATNGTLLGTGASFTTPSISATTTYYVQQRASQTTTYYTGKPYAANSSLKEFGIQGGEAHYGNRIVVNQTLTIKSVTFYVAGSLMAVDDVQLIAYNATGTPVPQYQSAMFDFVAQVTTPSQGSGFPHKIDVNMTLPPGTYFLGIKAPNAIASGSNPGISVDPTAVPAGYTVGTLCTIEGTAFKNWGTGFTGTTTEYGQIFDIVIEAAGNPCGRTAVQAIINCPPTVTLTSPAPPGPVYAAVGTNLTLTSTASDDGSVTGVVYEIRNASTNALITTVTGGSGPTYSASWTIPSNIQYTITAVATDNSSLSASSTSVTVDASVLPVDWLSFHAKKQNGDVVLTWSTASELNSDYFVVERSADGINFDAIGSVNSAGTSNEVHSYLFQDTEPLAGTSYYRLSQYDVDGAVSTSEVKVIHDLEASLSPNPFSTSLNVQVNEAGAYTLKISTLQGNVIYEENVQDGNVSHTVGETLRPGVYLLSISTAEGSVVYRIEKIN